MTYVIGRGSRFLAHLDEQQCAHCNAPTRRQLYAAYSSHGFWGLTDFFYKGIAVVCPICHQGTSHAFARLNSRRSRLFGGKKARAERAKTIALLESLAGKAHIRSTRSHYEQLSWLDKRRYRGMLAQLQLTALLNALLHEPPGKAV